MWMRILLLLPRIIFLNLIFLLEVEDCVKSSFFTWECLLNFFAKVIELKVYSSNFMDGMNLLKIFSFTNAERSWELIYQLDKFIAASVFLENQWKQEISTINFDYSSASYKTSTENNSKCKAVWWKAASHSNLVN